MIVMGLRHNNLAISAVSSLPLLNLFVTASPNSSDLAVMLCRGADDYKDDYCVYCVCVVYVSMYVCVCVCVCIIII